MPQSCAPDFAAKGRSFTRSRHLPSFDGQPRRHKVLHDEQAHVPGHIVDVQYLEELLHSLHNVLRADVQVQPRRPHQARVWPPSHWKNADILTKLRRLLPFRM